MDGKFFFHAPIRALVFFDEFDLSLPTIQTRDGLVKGEVDLPAAPSIVVNVEASEISESAAIN